MRGGEYLHPKFLNEKHQLHPHIDCVHEPVMFPVGV